MIGAILGVSYLFDIDSAVHRIGVGMDTDGNFEHVADNGAVVVVVVDVAVVAAEGDNIVVHGVVVANN